MQARDAMVSFAGLTITISKEKDGDIDVINEVIRYDAYKLKCLKEPKVIFDIGARIGCFILFAESLWPDAEIHALEPNVRSFNLLVKNARAFDNVHCYSAAIHYDGAEILVEGEGPPAEDS